MNYQTISRAKLRNLFLLTLVFVMLVSCHKHPDQRLENYRLIWRTDSNYVQLQQFRPDTINGRPCDLGCKLFQVKSSFTGNPVLTVSENKKGISLVSKDTTLPANKVTYTMGKSPAALSVAFTIISVTRYIRLKTISASRPMIT